MPDDAIDDLVNYTRTDREASVVEEFLSHHFDDDVAERDLDPEEVQLIREVFNFVDDNFEVAAYHLGLPIDFTLLANEVRASDAFDSLITSENMFDRYERITEWHGRTLATLSMRGEESGEKYGIRKFENQVRTLFHDGLARLDYPSAPGHNTSKWSDFPELLASCFRLSSRGRYELVNLLIDFGLDRIQRAETFQGNPRVRIFPRVISKYPRTGIAGENAGVVFQSIAYGYIRADRPHLSTIVSKVRTGSSRQKRIGDVDCYKDLSVELSVEVKDRPITANNVSDELGKFVRNVKRDDILGIALVKSATEEAIEKIEDDRLIVMTEADLLEEVRRWDWPKQDGALRDLIHFLAHIEQDAAAVTRLQHFIHEYDSEHDTLRNFTPEMESPSGD